MTQRRFEFDYEEFDSATALSESDRALFAEARQATGDAYAPYSAFYVGAAVRLANGKIVRGANQENVSFPAGLCAEGVAMASAASQFPGVAIEAIAITYRSSSGVDDQPVTPCGICRQSMQQYRVRSGIPIRLIMGGAKGKLIAVSDAAMLLPFSFTF